MKRIFLWLCMCLFIFSGSVKADKVYYSEYGEYSPYLALKPDISDVVEVDSKVFYKKYYLEKVYGDYYYEFQNPILYPYVNYNDYIVMPYTDWSTVEPDFNRNGRSVDIKVIGGVQHYRYSDRMYRYYYEEKIYIDDDSGYEGFDIKEEGEIYYRFRTRDKVITRDEFIIDKYGVALTDFIIYTTTPYSIIGQADYANNGKYDLIYRFPFIDIMTSAIIDIKENDIREGYLKQIDELLNKIRLLENELSEYKKLYGESLRELDDFKKKYNELLEKNQEYISKISLLENESILYKNLYEECLKEKEYLKTIYDELVKRSEEYINRIGLLENELSLYIRLSNDYLDQNEYLKNIYNDSLKKIEDLNKYIEDLNNLLKEQEKELYDYSARYEDLMNDYENLSITSRVLFEQQNECGEVVNEDVEQVNSKMNGKVLSISNDPIMITKMSMLFGVIFLIILIYVLILKRKKSIE